MAKGRERESEVPTGQLRVPSGATHSAGDKQRERETIKRPARLEIESPNNRSHYSLDESAWIAQNCLLSLINFINTHNFRYLERNWLIQFCVCVQWMHSRTEDGFQLRANSSELPNDAFAFLFVCLLAACMPVCWHFPFTSISWIEFLASF